ncbi:aryl-sulfate sulfotransferase [Ferrimonas pelagia]|uniref:Aryl-sulfate sulfotransferase n=1 Tax=Ferrimonas pelagia TaxID=1177826 RepID=A0ABP9F4M8_9GAMM
MKLSKVALLTALTICSTTALADGGGHRWAQGELGQVVNNPYGNAPQTAIIDLGGYKIDSATVKIHAKGDAGVPISYEVGKSSILNHDGIPLLGLYPDYNNTVEVSYTKNGKEITEEYKIFTPPVSVTGMRDGMQMNHPTVDSVTVAEGFEDRLYLVNHIVRTEGWDAMDWKDGMGSQTWDTHPTIFITDTAGDIRWTLDVSHFRDIRHLDKRGTMMGFQQMENGDLIFGQGQKIYRIDLMGQIVFEWSLPRGYIDYSHGIQLMDNGNYLVRAAKSNYLREDGQRVHTVRDHILEVDPTGKLVDVWDLNLILDNMRDAKLLGLDAGAVCLNVDADLAGETVKIEPDAPFGDIAGVGAGRNWVHVNSVEHDSRDDSIILSARHQGVVKISRDKEVVWILAPTDGWNDELAGKVLQPVNSDGSKIECSGNGICKDSDFDFTYSQHTAWLTGKTYNDNNGIGLTVFDNGDGRHHQQPPMVEMKYSRGVEYIINEDDMTVEQIWEYGKDRGYEWYSQITSNVSYEEDRDTMFMFSGNTYLLNRDRLTRAIINEVAYGTDEVNVELHVNSTVPGNAPYRSTIVDFDKAVAE